MFIPTKTQCDATLIATAAAITESRDLSETQSDVAV